ncbi:ATP-binding cassette domain-containing protein, partial [Acinetobacter baumannii]
GRYLSGAARIEVPAERHRPVDGQRLRIVNARGNNLKGVTVELPVGLLTCVTGVSGSGKSTLLNILGLLERMTSGSFRLDGEEVQGL